MTHTWNLSRRSLLQAGVLGLTGLSLPHALAANPHALAKSCILLYMDGGPSHIDLFDLKPHAPREIRGPYQPIATSVPGLEIGELMPQMAQRMHLLTLIRSMNHEQTVHDPAVYQMLTGYRHTSTAGGLKVEADDVPHMAAAFQAADRTPAIMPKAIELPETMHMDGRILPGQNAGFMGASFDPLHVNVTPQGLVQAPDFRRRPEIDLPRLEYRQQLLRQTSLPDSFSTEAISRFETYQRQALGILHSPEVARAFELERESSEVRDRYGRHRHGQSVLLARRLIEAGSRFVTVYWGREDQDWADGRGPRAANNPWDTHRNHFPLVKETLVPRADQTFSALLDDLSQRGLLDETLVVWMGDFGRTPRITQPWASRDHWPFAFSLMVAGAGVPQGFVLGKTDQHAAYITDRPVSPADLTATIFHLLGVNPRTLVEDHRHLSHPISQGTPISELLG